MAKHRKPRQWGQIFKHKRLWLVAIVLLILISGGVMMAHHRQQADEKPSYQTITARKESNFTLTGKVAANERQVLTLPDGKLQSLNVQDGDHVVKGETILTTSYDVSQDNGDDQQNGGTTSSSDDTSSGTSDQNTESNDQDQSSSAAPASPTATIVHQTNTLTAPYSGYVSVDQTKQGQPIVTLYSDNLQFSGEVSEYDYNKLHNGTNLHVLALATGKKETTPVNYVSLIPAKDSGNTAKYKVTANLNSSRFIIGQTLRATVAQDGVRLPSSAVVHHHVFIEEANGRVRYAQVSGHAVNGSFIVTDGVYVGDKVVTNPDRHLKNNMKVDSDD